MNKDGAEGPAVVGEHALHPNAQREVATASSGTARRYVALVAIDLDEAGSGVVVDGHEDESQPAPPTCRAGRR